MKQFWERIGRISRLKSTVAAKAVHEAPAAAAASANDTTARWH
jgi:hypothetical protein